ncbi:hypothetical protein [Trichococcus paludicola]|uniref:hypothetical protein n=1 Tax=Trichococcus paludicola TaxID=2052942 RepID=UPI000D3AB94D|nr:hypothetical protein [Trichococcus paludicola]
MEKEFRTITYSAALKDGAMRLKLDTGKGKFIQKNVEVKANVNLETGEVHFFVDKADLDKLSE